ncbi:MAG: hypothetical protein JXR77_11125 [Lentisphaeria bacterium]|nr:hypothetical protein [Lentisphaeria bacterium]
MPALMVGRSSPAPVPTPASGYAPATPPESGFPPEGPPRASGRRVTLAGTGPETAARPHAPLYAAPRALLGGLLAAVLLPSLASCRNAGSPAGSGVLHAAGSPLAVEARTMRTALTRDDVLSIREGRFYLEGGPFAEISFNKFDLFWQLFDQLAAGNALDDANPMVQAQDKALRDLDEMGFRSIRIFALPWGPRGPAAYADPGQRRVLYAALDRTVELCERHDIRLVWSLGAGAFTDTQLVPGEGWVYGEEQMRELVANPDSRGRRLLYEYIDETVARYRDRKTVLMWEITNELTLAADIGDRDRVYNGQRMPTLKEVAVFTDEVARRIQAADPLRLVNNGGSHMREHQWHLYRREGWVRDTFDEQFKCFELVFADSAVDVIDIHSYPNNRQGYIIQGPDGKETLLDHQGYMEIARRLGKPLMIGELGLHAAARTNTKIWEETPDYFESFADTAAAKPWVERTLDSVIDAGVQLSYWWCYQSDRPMDQNNPQRFDISRDRNPELLRCFVEANRRLKERLDAR